MRTRTQLAGLLLTLGVAGSIAPASAGIGISVDIAPPPPRVVEVPPPRPGYVWAPGYWDWDGRGYVWVDGRWEVARRGHRWHERRWVERDHHWYAEGGAWEDD